jgi:acetylornithine deacetylase
MGRGRTGPEYSEQSVAEFVLSYLKKNAIDAEMQPGIPGRPNVLGRVSAGATQTVLLEAHLDTVHADSMTVKPFDPVIRDGKLFGRGSCDTKGSIAAFLQGVTNAIKKAGTLRYNILLLFVSDEEYRFTGAQHAVKRGLRADFGIVGEPTQLKIVRAHKGVTRWKIFTKGIAAHSAYPGRGNNAIYSMSRIVGRLEEYAAELNSAVAHPVLGSPSLSVGVIEGGQAVNIVPDRCWIEIDRRTLPNESTQTVIEPVRSLLQDLSDWEMKEPYLSVSGMEVSATAPVVQTLATVVKEVVGDVVVEGAQYATDAGIYNAVGVPSVVFGPGDIAQAHTDSEFISLEQLDDAVAIIGRLLIS